MNNPLTPLILGGTATATQLLSVGDPPVFSLSEPASDWLARPLLPCRTQQPELFIEFGRVEPSFARL